MEEVWVCATDETRLSEFLYVSYVQEGFQHITFPMERMSHLYSSTYTNDSPLKKLCTRILALMSPGRTKELMQAPQAKPVGIRDRAIMAFLKSRAAKQGGSDFLEKLHMDFWRGDGGRVFSENCDHRFEDLFLNKQREDFDALAKLWRESHANRIVEVGCNSGLLLNFLTVNGGRKAWRPAGASSAD